MLDKETKREYQRDYMRKYRAGEQTVKENGLSHLIDKLEWKDIPGYPGYKASKCGQILSCDRAMIRGNGRPHTVPVRVLKQNPDGNGYLQVGLYVDNKKRMRQVARLVYLAWHGEITPEYMEVDHIDNNPLNNRSDNLQLLTPQQNVQKIMADARLAGFQAGYAQALKDMKEHQ